MTVKNREHFPRRVPLIRRRISNMNLCVFASFTALLSSSALADFQSPLDEQWVLSKDKSGFLKTLTPGTDNYFFYHALHQQQSGQTELFRKTMNDWLGLHKSGTIPGPRAAQLLNRQTLLDYEAGVTGANEALRKVFDLSQPKTRTDLVERKELPSTLNPDDISSAAFVKELGLITEIRLIKSASKRQLLRLAAEDKKWPKLSRDIFLRRVDHAGLPNIEKLILANFKESRPLPISQISCAKNLSRSQLQSLADIEPDLLNDRSFVGLIIQSMQPEDRSIFKRDPEKHLAWLLKLDGFTRTLSPSHNSLKAHVLYHRLRIASEMDQFPSETFVRYLNLPRPKTPIWSKHAIDTKHPSVSFNQSFFKYTECAPIGNELELIEKFLDNNLVEAAQQELLAKYFDAQYFKERTSRSQLLAGVDSYKLDHPLSATDYEVLRDLKELSIADSTNRQWSHDSLVKLNVDLKNVDNLTVSIYALDSLRYTKETGKEIGHELDLSSMIPNTSRTIETKESPFLRHRKVIELPELSNVGSWMVELHGNGQRVTALIHKGEIHHCVRDTGDGQEVFVSDFDGKPLKGVQVYVEGKQWTSDDEGLVQMPYSPYVSRTNMRLHLTSEDRENGITRVVELNRRGAATSLEIASISHPEQWLADQKATFYYKPSFLVNGKSGSLDRIESSQVILSATLRDGQEIELVRESIKLSSNDFLPLSFTVPQNLFQLQIEVTSKLKPIAGRETPKVSATKQLVVTPAPKANRLAHHYFYQVGETWFLQCLGRNGEPWPDVTVTAEFSHRDFTKPIRHKLVTDTDGIIELGKLSNITRVGVSGNLKYSAAKLDLTVQKDNLALADYYPADEEIECLLNHVSPLNRYDYSLRGAGSDKKDYFSALSLKDNKLSCGQLTAGKYILKTPHSPAQKFEILDANTHGQWLTLQGQAVELPPKKAAQISKVTHSEGKLKIKLSHSGPYTRIHLIASQFTETTNPYQPALPKTLGQSHFGFGFVPSIYSNGGTLSGEHQYILSRRLAGNKLGVMLERPAWHLQPWKTEASESYLSEMGEGEAGGRGRLGSLSQKKSSKRGSAAKNEEFGSSPIKFLENKAIVLANLTADKEGNYELNLDKLAGHRRVDVIVTQGQNVDSMRIALPETELKTIDLRLAKSFDSSKQFRAGETNAVLKAGASASIENVVDADWKAYSTLEDAYSYFFTHIKDEHHSEALRAIAPILHWPKLDQEDRLELLGNAGSHELHLFIKNRDSEWFKAHVAPMLGNKRHKQFFDHYLLDHDLSAYATAGKFHTLNTMEQALLAQRLKSEPIAEKLESDYLRVRPDTEAETELFTSLLKQGFDSELDEVKRNMASHSSALYIRRKLQNIIIPVIDFQDVTVDQAIDILRQRVRELDTVELDPMEKGVNYVVRTPTVTGSGVDDEAGEFGGATRPDSKTIRSLQLRNVPLEVVIKQICDMTQLRYKIEDGVVVFLPVTDFDDSELYTRSFKVPSDFIELIYTTPKQLSINLTPPVKDLLIESGVVFPEGATATFNRSAGKLTVRNTANNLDLIEQLTGVLHSNPPRNGLELPKNALAKRTVSLSLSSLEFAESVSDDPFSDDSGGSALSARQPLVEPSALPHETKAYAESNYYHRLSSDGALSIAPNAFWVDVAKWDGESAFLSPHFAECRDNVHESMIALALLDLTFEAVKPEIELDKTNMRITAKQAMLLYYRDLKSTKKVDLNKGLLSSLRYFRGGDILREDADGTVSENAITGKFQIHTPYEAHLTLTNPTGVAREVDILRQIPAGAIRLDTSDTISALRTTIAPHGSWQHVVQFYFPSAGSWQHYSPRIHEGATLLSQMKDKTLEVADTLPEEFANSWAQLVVEGSNEEILNALKSRPLQLIEIDWLDEHMAEKAFYTPAIQTLQERMVDTSVFATQAIEHRDIPTLTHFLGDPMHCTNQFGYYFKSESIDTTPYSMRQFEDIEWRPLINERSFPLVTENRVSNEKVWSDYLRLLTQLAWKTELASEEKLTLAYHLFLHDRNDEAIALIADCKRDETGAKMQFDYLTSYIHFLKGEPAKAKEIAQIWLKSAKAPWLQRFSDIATQADQISNAALLKPHEVNQHADRFWSASLSKGNTLRIEHKQMEDIVVQIYPVDLEFLFSNAPFLGSNDASYKALRPLQEFVVKLDEEKSTTEFKLPESYQSGNRLLVIDDGEKEWLHPLQSTKLSTTINSASGMLQSLTQGKPMPRCYVKVYALTKDGSVNFFKDGHTDLRGMFDYRSHNVHAPADVQSFALFISHPELGSITKIIGDARPNDSLLPPLD